MAYPPNLGASYYGPWPTNSPHDGDPAQQSGASAGAGTQDSPIAVSPSLARALYAASQAGNHPGVARAISGGHSSVGHSWSQEPIINEPTAPPDAGIQVGEIVGWRAWRRGEDGLLRSVSMPTVWPIGGISADQAPDRTHGVYAFKTEEQALTCFAANGQMSSNRLVIGRVALWGEVWEFDKGYHGEHAKIVSLDYPKRGMFSFKDDPLVALRELYGVKV